MRFPETFIAAGDTYATLDHPVPAPYLRRAFHLPSDVTEATIIVAGLGFYELYVNGKLISKPLAPYINAPDDIIYFNRYDVASLLSAGENVIGLLLGNGMHNALGGFIWDFDKARWRGAPMAALRLEAVLTHGEPFTLESDELFKTHPSPVIFNDLRIGEIYDARLELPGWNEPGFNEEHWQPARKVHPPRGEYRLCEADPIAVSGGLEPVSVTPFPDGLLFDFGINTAGVCRLTVNGTPGQSITLTHGEELQEDGTLYMTNLIFKPGDNIQRDMYLCKGGEPEIYAPRFTYHGFRYVWVTGVTDTQDFKLVYLEMHSDLRERGWFECSDSMVNTLQTLTRRSTLANFFYFPTDCPHREKNGWTGDAAISAEHTLLNVSPETSYREWLRNIRKAQNEQGQLPGIVPTGGWGFAWGNGPAWDCVLTYLPYYTYVYRGDKDILRENGTAIFRYVHYLSTQLKNNGLLELGLGDWCPPGRASDAYKSPVLFTDSVISMDICNKAAFIFHELGWELPAHFAESLALKLRNAIRAQLMDFNTMTAVGNCQTSQSMALYYGLFEPQEKTQAFTQLLRMINETAQHMDTGILGARVIFHVLSEFGYSDLAHHMITTKTFPSYGNWVARGATSLWEDFQPEGAWISSRNHHFFGDISAWFIKHIAGVQYNPTGRNHTEVKIAPSFIKEMDFANGYHLAPGGKIDIRWKRTGEGVELQVTLPEAYTGEIVLPQGWHFGGDSGTRRAKIGAGTGVYSCVTDK